MAYMQSSEGMPLKVVGRQFQEEIGEALGLEEEQYGQPVRMEEGGSLANEEMVSIGYRHDGAVFSTPPALAEEIGHYLSHKTVDGSRDRVEGHNIVEEMLGNLGRALVFPENVEALVDKYDEIASGLDSRANEEHQEYIQERIPEYISHLHEVREELEDIEESFGDAEELYERAKELQRDHMKAYAEFRAEIESQGLQTETEIPNSADREGTRTVKTAPAVYLEKQVFQDPELFSTEDERLGLGYLRSAAEGEKDVGRDNLLNGGEITRARRRVENSIETLERDRSEGVERVLDGMVGWVSIDQYDAEHVIGRILAKQVHEEGREEEVFHMSNEELIEEYGEEIESLKQEYMFDGMQV